jgi:putative transposase
VGLWQSSYYYRSVRKDDEGLRKRIRELAEERRRFGQYRLYIMLRREGWSINHKKVERIYREEGLQVRRRKRKKIVSAVRVPLPVPSRPHQHWSMDFLMDVLSGGRRVRVLAVVDDYTRECLAVEVDTSLNGTRVTQVLDRLIEFYGKPEGISLDNGPEFAGRVLDAWAYRNKVRLDFIRPGKPTENAYIESFNGRLRDECLNENEWTSLGEARETIDLWKEDYNQRRPHSSLGFLTPKEFAEQQAERLESQNQEKVNLNALQ